MGRLNPAFLERVESFSDRMVGVAETLAGQRSLSRVVDQMIGCGTSVGANVFEADEALSRADFAKTLGIAIKEVSETRFWLRLAARRKWVKPERLASLQKEATELKLILGAMISRTRRHAS
ncbi:MAG: four helix bundle protein [Phycisphaeraceae bacterium]|nr:four helix bundle protein [Phycisphaeraceae bacterium]